MDEQKICRLEIWYYIVIIIYIKIASHKYNAEKMFRYVKNILRQEKFNRKFFMSILNLVPMETDILVKIGNFYEIWNVDYETRNKRIYNGYPKLGRTQMSSLVHLSLARIKVEKKYKWYSYIYGMRKTNNKYHLIYPSNVRRKFECFICTHITYPFTIFELI